MSEEKRLKARVAHKHKTEAEWYLDVYTATDSTIKRSDPFIPWNGELIIFDPDTTNTKKRFKFGDGKTDVIELPFISADSPLKIGEGESSVVNIIHNSYEGYRQNEAVSDYSAALGASNIAGALAFNIIGYDVENMTYTLSTAIPETTLNWTTMTEESIPVGVDNGAEYTVVIPSVNRNKLGRITNISEDRKTVTVTKLEVGKATDWEDTSNCYFKFINYPLAGDVPFGTGAYVSGTNNMATALGAFASGTENIADGKYAFAAGRGNYVGYAGAATGSYNEVTGLTATAAGYKNKASAQGSHAINMYNEAAGQSSFVAGYGNITNYAGQSIVGRFNAKNGSALFIVGNGTSDGDKVTTRDKATSFSNAFEVLKDGRATIGKAPIYEMDVANKGYVDNINTLLTKKIEADTVRSYNDAVNYIDTTLNNVLGKEKTGTYIALDDMLPDSTLDITAVEPTDFVIYPTNLLERTFTPKKDSEGNPIAQNGVTYQILDDGYIQVSGNISTAIDVIYGTVPAMQSGQYFWSMNQQYSSETVGSFRGRLRIYSVDENNTKTLLIRVDGWDSLLVDVDNASITKFDKDGAVVGLSGSDTTSGFAEAFAAATIWEFHFARTTNGDIIGDYKFRPQINEGTDVLPFEYGFCKELQTPASYIVDRPLLHIKSLGDGEITCKYTSTSVASDNTSLEVGYSEYSYELGYECEAGAKGYLITASDNDTSSYILDGELPVEAIGKIFSARIYNNYLEQGKITAIEGNKITVTNHVPFYTGTRDDGSTYFYVWNKAGTQEIELTPESIRFWISSMPGIGSHDFGCGAVAFGENTNAVLDGSLAAGYGTRALGRYAVALGNSTTAYHAGFAAGVNTIAKGNYSAAFGSASQANGQFSLAGGQISIVDGDNSIGFGRAIKSTGAEQAVFGAYNVDTPNAALVVGAGDQTNGRNNALVVFKDGTIRGNNLTLTDPRDLVPLGYLSANYVRNSVNETGRDCVYVRTSANNNTLREISSGRAPNTIVMRDNNGDIPIIDVPVSDNAAVSKTFVASRYAKLLENNDTTNKVYVQKANGNGQGLINYSSGNVAGAIISRDDNGAARVNAPASSVANTDNYIVNYKTMKNYIASELGNIEAALDNIIDIQNSLLGGNT